MRKKTFAIGTTLVLLLGCRRTQSDAEIQALLIGTWRVDQEPSKTIQNKPDGSYIVQLARGSSNTTIEGTWEVKAGFVIAAMTNAPPWFGPQDPVARHKAESNKVVSIDEHKMVLLSSQNGTTVLTAHKQ